MHSANVDAGVQHLAVALHARHVAAGTEGAVRAREHDGTAVPIAHQRLDAISQVADHLR